MKKILIIGKNAYLSQGLEKKLYKMQVTKVSRFEKNRADFYQSFDVIINFTIQPEFSKQDLPQKDIIDIQIAKILKKSKTKLIMISSRKVYGITPQLKTFSEDSELLPSDFYAKNKVKTEQKLQKILPKQLIVLRIPNIIGDPIKRIGYKTFMGWISESILTSQKLVVTEDLNTKKDFITKSYLHYVLYKLIKQEVYGIFNVGSGFCISIEELLTKMIDKNTIIFMKKFSIKDQFVLNSQKVSKYVQPFSKKDLIKQCHKNKLILKKFTRIETYKLS